MRVACFPRANNAMKAGAGGENAQEREMRLNPNVKVKPKITKRVCVYREIRDVTKTRFHPVLGESEMCVLKNNKTHISP